MLFILLVCLGFNPSNYSASDITLSGMAVDNLKSIIHQFVPRRFWSIRSSDREWILILLDSFNWFIANLSMAVCVGVLSIQVFLKYFHHSKINQ